MQATPSAAARPGLRGRRWAERRGSGTSRQRSGTWRECVCARGVGGVGWGGVGWGGVGWGGGGWGKGGGWGQPFAQQPTPSAAALCSTTHTERSSPSPLMQCLLCLSMGGIADGARLYTTMRPSFPTPHYPTSPHPTPPHPTPPHPTPPHPTPPHPTPPHPNPLTHPAPMHASVISCPAHQYLLRFASLATNCWWVMGLNPVE
jgi:hypothetical protein